MTLKPVQGPSDWAAQISQLSTEQLTRDLITLRIVAMKEAIIQSGKTGALSKVNDKEWDSMDPNQQKAVVDEYVRIMDHDYLFKTDQKFKAYHEAFEARMDADTRGTFAIQANVQNEMVQNLPMDSLDRHIIIGSGPTIGQGYTRAWMGEVVKLSRQQLPELK